MEINVKLDPKGAADAIRELLHRDPVPVEPEDRHQLSFLEQVCEHLGIDANALNVSHVAHLMNKAGVDQHHPDEYPKMLTEKDHTGRLVPVKYPDNHPKAGQTVVFHSADDEAEYHSPSNDDPKPADSAQALDE